jgi:predicted methyltransferase
MKTTILLLTLVSICLTCTAAEHRSADNIARDEYRHPKQTLDFLDVQPHHTVVEIWPGSGWYSEILAPMLKEQGKYYAAHFPTDSPIKFFRSSRSQFEQKITQSADIYSNVSITNFAPPQQLNIAPAGSVDRVLTFRNVHNWMKNDSEQHAFSAFYKALKPGGILGVIEHKAPDHFNLQKMVDSGYVGQWYVIKLAKEAGFKLLASSPINTNMKDTKDHPNGVWTLPPTLRLPANTGKRQQEKYRAIGESDRMTLTFIKEK